MNVYDKRIPDQLFAAFLRSMPQVSVELVVEHDGSVLLLKRANEPAKGEWFWPGTRLYKGERFSEAAQRLAQRELGVNVELARQHGVYDHFWDTGNLPEVETTHTVNVVYHALLLDDPADIQLDEQHEAYRLVDEIEPGLHKYVKQYLEDTDIMK